MALSPDSFLPLARGAARNLLPDPGGRIPGIITIGDSEIIITWVIPGFNEEKT
jgi:hypothetical protein